MLWNFSISSYYFKTVLLLFDRNIELTYIWQESFYDSFLSWVPLQHWPSPDNVREKTLKVWNIALNVSTIKMDVIPVLDSATILIYGQFIFGSLSFCLSTYRLILFCTILLLAIPHLVNVKVSSHWLFPGGNFPIVWYNQWQW